MTSAVPGEFELTPSESFLYGTDYRDGRLVLRPTLVRRAMAVPAALVAAGLGARIVAEALERTAWILALAIVAAVAMTAGGVWLTVGFLRSKVVASVHGLVVHDRWHRHEWAWHEVKRVNVLDSQVARIKASPSQLVDWKPWPGESTPVLELTNRTKAPLWVLSSTRRDEAFSLGAPTPAEQHAAILARLHGVARGVPPTYVPDPSR